MILTRKSHNCAGTAFVQGDSAGGSKLTEQTLTPLSLKSDDSNFVQNYFRIGSVFCDKKNRDQINNDVTMTSSLL